MKFYYKGQLIRTSKTHDYAYAVVREKEDGKVAVWGCSSTYDGAQTALKAAMRAYQNRNHYIVVELERK